MTAIDPFPYAVFLHTLEAPDATTNQAIMPVLSGLLATKGEQGDARALAGALAVLLRARKAVFDAAASTTLAADELRRYQKYAKPGKPSAHIVQLRQKQAAARQATSVARQSLIKAAAVLVREAGIEPPARMPLDEFIVGWIDANVPRDAP